MPRLSSLIIPLVASAAAVDAALCNADNCLRALRATNRVEAARSFCATFTTSPVTETSAIPSYAVQACTGDVASRVSSACSCLPTVSSTSTATSSAGSSTTSVVPSTTPVVSSSSTTTVEITTTTSTTTSSSLTTSSSTPSPAPIGPKQCLNPQLSCRNTTAVEDLCCFNAPGGQLLLTQFWDTAPSTGPNNSWTVHGLWPDHCDGTYDAFCDTSREYFNITAILQSYGKTDLLSYMNEYWKDYKGDDEDFWEHEWNKHGTCMSTLEPKCYNGYKGQAEVVDYFQITVDLFKGLDSFATLEKAGIVPSTSETYTSAQIQAALTAAHGYPVTISCKTGQLEEIWYHYLVLGSVQTGEFVPTSPDGSKSNCPATGIKYVPKYLPPTSTTSRASSTPTPTGAPYQGKGFLQAYTSGANKGCLISAGTWYTTGTCATYTAAASGTGFTLTSSKGPCDIIAGAFSCATGNTAGVFTAVDSKLAYAGATTFYAAAVPSGTVQQKVYTATNAVQVSFSWQSV